MTTTPQKTETGRKPDLAARAEVAERTYAPATDILNRADDVLVRVDLPGVEEKELNVDLDNDTLTISGSVGPETREKHTLLYRGYEPAGRYARSFKLTEEVDTEGIKASFRDGVLTLTLPKRKAAQPRRIEVKND